MTSLRSLTDAASELGKDAKDSVEELARSAGKKLDEAQDDTAGALHTAATSVRATGRKGSAAIDNLACGTADRLDATADFVEEYKLRDVVAGLRKFGRSHVAGTVVCAAAVGFLAGAGLQRAAHSCRVAEKA